MLCAPTAGGHADDDKDYTLKRPKKCKKTHKYVRKSVYLHINTSEKVENMKRNAINYLEKWKKSKDRKPLIIRGVRQVGKTWLMKEFGRIHYRNVAYINFESALSLKRVFSADFDIQRIITAFEIETGVKIEKNNTLIILDEIQEAERGVTVLKYFYEEAPQYHVMAAGSLLGVALHQQTSFPVGKVDFMDLQPMGFTEFLEAIGQSKLAGLLYNREWDLIKAFKERFVNLLKHYYFTGGMPEAVLEYKASNDFNRIRTIQKSILRGYEQDFSKHAPVSVIPRINMLWNSVPAQLAKENKKFIYGAIRKGARAKDFELALNWLCNSGVLYKVHRIKKPGMPLKAYEDFNVFKLFIFDVGLLGAMSELSAKTLIEGNRIFEEFKGALTEQYVLQQLRLKYASDIYYWSAERSSGEIDFIVQDEEDIIPIEVKAEENLKAKSLKSFIKKYPHTKPVRISMSDYREESWMVNLPLYAVESGLR